MPQFSLKVTPGDKVQIIISVSKKVSKKAVVRNRIKRRVRATLRPLAKNLKPANYLFIARAGADKVKGKDLEELLFKLIRSIQGKPL